MQLNCAKTKEMLICFPKTQPNIPPVNFDEQSIEKVDTCKLLGVTISADLTWKHHVKNICKKASQRLYLLCLLKRVGVTHAKDLIQVIKTLIRPLVEYACELWHCGLTT